MVIVMPRRSGKDFTTFTLMIKQAQKVVGDYFIYSPSSYTATKHFEFLLDILSVHPQIVPCRQSFKRDNQIVVFENGSRIVVNQSKSIKNLARYEPAGVIFSEFASHAKETLSYIPELLARPDCWVIFQSTPLGKNMFWLLVEYAKSNPECWYYSVDITVTNHVDIDEIDRELKNGVYTQLGVERDFYCKFL